MAHEIPKPSRSDPTPERRVGDASMKPVIVAFVLTILIILIAAIIFVKARQSKVMPKTTDQHPTTQMTPYQQMPVPGRFAV